MLRFLWHPPVPPAWGELARRAARARRWPMDRARHACRRQRANQRLTCHRYLREWLRHQPHRRRHPPDFRSGAGDADRSVPGLKRGGRKLKR
jgi:hypothetical protein